MQTSCIFQALEPLPRWLLILSPAGFYYYWGSERQNLNSVCSEELKNHATVTPCQVTHVRRMCPAWHACVMCMLPRRMHSAAVGIGCIWCCTLQQMSVLLHSEQPCRSWPSLHYERS